MNWVIFSLISRALWAADNIVDKLLIGKYLRDSVVLTLITGISASLLSTVIVIFNGLSWIGLKPIALVIFAGAIQIPAVFAFYKAISKEEISRVIPLFQFTPLFVLILSLLFLGEVLTLNHYLAFVLILLGVF
jgi:transporter family protein